MLILGIFSIMTAVALPNIHINPTLLNRTGVIVLLYSAALSYNVMDFNAINNGLSIYSGLFNVTSITMFRDTFMFIVGALCLVPFAPIRYNNLNKSNGVISEFSLIILFSICGSTFLMSSADLVSIYLSIELQSFAVYILAALYRDSESATSAGLKYFLLGGLSSRLILLGSALIYSYTGLTNMENIFSIMSVVSDDSNTSMQCMMGLAIMVVGFLFKVSAAPFHNWSPDVYDGVPTNVTIWLAIMPKISIFVFLLELQSGLGFTGLSSLSIMINERTGQYMDIWKNLLLFSSLLSLIIGTVVGLAQYKIKRLLAYSTISHVGFLLLALAINSEESVESFLFYLIQYTVTNLNAFLIVLAYGFYINANSVNVKENKDVNFISDLSGQFYANPLLGLALTLSLFSMAGVPPLIGFFGKQMVLYSATHRGYYFLSLVAIVVSVISASYYLKIVRVIHFDKLPANNSTTTSPATLTNLHAFSIATLTMAITLFVFKPSIILNSTSLLALTLFQS
jgi:NADH-ubiquinone oxidoreductase chain 2